MCQCASDDVVHSVCVVGGTRKVMQPACKRRELNKIDACSSYVHGSSVYALPRILRLRQCDAQCCTNTLQNL